MFGSPQLDKNTAVFGVAQHVAICMPQVEKGPAVCSTGWQTVAQAHSIITVPQVHSCCILCTGFILSIHLSPSFLRSPRQCERETITEAPHKSIAVLLLVLSSLSSVSSSALQQLFRDLVVSFVPSYLQRSRLPIPLSRRRVNTTINMSQLLEIN